MWVQIPPNFRTKTMQFCHLVFNLQGTTDLLSKHLTTIRESLSIHNSFLFSSAAFSIANMAAQSSATWAEAWHVSWVNPPKSDSNHFGKPHQLPHWTQAQTRNHQYSLLFFQQQEEAIAPQRQKLEKLSNIKLSHRGCSRHQVQRKTQMNICQNSVSCYLCLCVCPERFCYFF